MDEQGFEFRRGPQRRERSRFEPPPWEKDAFEELQRRRADGLDEVEAVPLEVSVAAPVQGESEPDSPKASPSSAAGPDPAGSTSGGRLDEGAVLEMMAGLAEEEPAPTLVYQRVAIGTGMGLLALGAVLIIWGMAALVSSGQTGLMGQIGGVGLGLFGAFFIGMGLWLLYRTLKQRGVL